MLILLLFLQLRAVTMQHEATLYYQNQSCSSNNPCQLQVWRAVCSDQNSCPQYVPGATNWTQVSTGSASASPKPNGTQWVVKDQDPALQDDTTYVYVATNSYQSTPTVYSDPGPPWSGTTGHAAVGTPVVPTVGTGNSVN